MFVPADKIMSVTSLFQFCIFLFTNFIPLSSADSIFTAVNLLRYAIPDVFQRFWPQILCNDLYYRYNITGLVQIFIL